MSPGEQPGPGEGPIPPAVWAAAMDPSMPAHTAEINGQRVSWDNAEPRVQPETPGFLVPRALLDDYADMGDILGKAPRGEISLKSADPVWHRCLACWLVSLLPGHDRCEHGYMAGCGECS